MMETFFSECKSIAPYLILSYIAFEKPEDILGLPSQMKV